MCSGELQDGWGEKKRGGEEAGSGVGRGTNENRSDVIIVAVEKKLQASTGRARVK